MTVSLCVLPSSKGIFFRLFCGVRREWGKTTLARIYAKELDAEFFELSAVSAGKADIKKIVDEDVGGKQKILFLDEIHRFNKAQQDYLLPFAETGRIDADWRDDRKSEL